MVIRVNPKLILIGGAPGIGKSSLARQLKKTFAKGVTLETDELWGCINNVDWYNQEQHLVALQQTFLLAESYFNLGFQPIIVVDVFTNRSLVRTFELLEKHKTLKPYKIISLFMDDSQLKDRVLSRGEGWKNLESCYYCNREIQTQNTTNQTLINIDGLDKETLAKKVLPIIKKG